MIRRVLIAVVLLVFAALAVLGGTLWWVKRAMDTPHEHQKASEYISIEKGTAPPAVIGKLVSEGVIADGSPVLMYLRLYGDASKIKAGDYKFPSPITPLQVLAELEKGEERVTRLTIPEGFTIFDISKRIHDFLQRTQGDKYEPSPPLLVGDKPPTPDRYVLQLMDSTSDIKDISPEAKNLEGYMYPSTYEIAPDARPVDIIDQMVGQFRKQWKPEWTAAAKAKGLTPHQVVTIASLIETESKYPQERPIVASVIFNRLSKTEIRKIVDVRIGEIQKRLLGGFRSRYPFAGRRRGQPDDDAPRRNRGSAAPPPRRDGKEIRARRSRQTFPFLRHHLRRDAGSAGRIAEAPR